MKACYHHECIYMYKGVQLKSSQYSLPERRMVGVRAYETATYVRSTVFWRGKSMRLYSKRQLPRKAGVSH